MSEVKLPLKAIQNRLELLLNEKFFLFTTFVLKQELKTERNDFT